METGWSRSADGFGTLETRKCSSTQGLTKVASRCALALPRNTWAQFLSDWTQVADLAGVCVHGSSGSVLLSALFSTTVQLCSLQGYYFQPKICPLNIRARPVKVRFWAIGEGIHVLEGLGWDCWRVVVVPGGWGVGANPIPKAHEFSPQWPRTSPSLASLMLSGQTFRLKIITL